MEGDDPGVLGNLPRSRPGTRSEKRAGPSGAGSARPPGRQPGGQEDEGGGTLVGGGTLLAAGRLAAAGLRTGTAVTREVLRRLPRP